MNLTIGIPVYNEEKNILKLLKSLKNQSYSKFLIIISDNYSTDKTYEIINKKIKNDKRFLIYRQKKNIGSHKSVEEQANEFLYDSPFEDHDSNIKVLEDIIKEKKTQKITFD